MKVADFLRPEWTMAEITSQDKEGVLAQMVEALESTGTVSDKERAVAVLLEREQLGSTGIGEGIAIPHGKMSELNEVVSVFGRSVSGVDFDSMDGAPVNIFFLLMAPEDSASLHLKALARISRLLKSRSFRDDLMKCSTSEEIYQKIIEEDEKE